MEIGWNLSVIMRRPAFRMLFTMEVSDGFLAPQSTLLATEMPPQLSHFCRPLLIIAYSYSDSLLSYVVVKKKLLLKRYFGYGPRCSVILTVSCHRDSEFVSSRHIR
jgi:hypothetical protein